MADGREPIEDDEILYRRIPTQPAYHDPNLSPLPTPKAFHPRRDDRTGLSVYRAKYKMPKQVAANDRSKTFYVAELRAGELREQGIEIIPAPLPDDPGHAELPGIKYDDRKSDSVVRWELLLAHKLCRILGPYGPEDR